jgi:hypothetical protein
MNATPMKRSLRLAIAFAVTLLPAITVMSQETTAMKVRFTMGGNELATATLKDNAAARDLVALLPITLTREDYAGTEKISYLPRKLSKAGDIAYYAPWGNLAIFYKDFRYSKALVLLGRIDSGIDALRVPGALKVTIEPVGK